jgi:NADPH:quinone reductase-like Zn-dependent oxidoreductase
MKSITIAQVALGGSHKGGLKARNRLRAIGEAVTAMILKGDLEVPVTSVIPLESTADALKEMLKANTTGKIVMSLM